MPALTEANSAFWTELCGTAQARQLGVVDGSPSSLRKFDDWYFDFYPYLDRHIPFGRISGQRVLEVGLGYGTVAQRPPRSTKVWTSRRVRLPW